MKKSVLISFDRYQQLLNKAKQNENCNNNDLAETSTQKQSQTCAIDIGPQFAQKLDSDIICSCFPVKKQTEVRELLKSIHDSGKVTYNEHGNVLLDGVLIDGINISDIIQRVIYKEHESNDKNNLNWIKKWRVLMD